MMQISKMPDETTIKIECDCGDIYYINLVNSEETPIALYGAEIRNVNDYKEPT